MQVISHIIVVLVKKNCWVFERVHVFYFSQTSFIPHPWRETELVSPMAKTFLKTQNLAKYWLKVDKRQG